MRATLALGVAVLILPQPVAFAAHRDSVAHPAVGISLSVKASPTPLQDAIARDSRAIAPTWIRRVAKVNQNPRNRTWIQRHPACFGSAVGFVAGFLIGFLPGDDAVFDDFTAAFNGGVLGGIGAGAGAIIGWAVGRD